MRFYTHFSHDEEAYDKVPRHVLLPSEHPWGGGGLPQAFPDRRSASHTRSALGNGLINILLGSGPATPHAPHGIREEYHHG
jgi:hypothetical protein